MCIALCVIGTLSYITFVVVRALESVQSGEQSSGMFVLSFCLLTAPRSHQVNARSSLVAIRRLSQIVYGV